MNEIKCPNCSTVFQINEEDYDSIVKQVRDKEFEREINLRDEQAKIDKENAVKIAESNRRFTFEIRDAGLYEIRIKELDEMSATVSEVVIYKTFSYSEEYNEFTEKEPIGASLLELLVNNGGGASVTDPVEVFMNFSKTLKREYDPRILFLILIIIFVLFDIAVRKFKFKWPHELVREYKQRKADNAKKKGEPRETR